MTLLCHPSVASSFARLQVALEGYCSYMYCDVKGKVTTGEGNLIDDIASACALTWRNPDGSLATSDAVTAAWHAVKSAPASMWPHGGAAYATLTTIRLDDATITALINARLAIDEAVLVKRLPNYPTLPADAQMGILSIAWAAGPACAAPHLFNALDSLTPDFGVAAYESSDNFRDLTPERKAFNKKCFNNARSVAANGLDPTVLYYPLAI